MKRQARQDQDRNVSVCWVVSDPGEPGRIRGYYNTLSAYSVKLTELPEDVRKRLPRYPDVPAALLSRLAVDIHFRRQTLGEHLLLDAMQKVLAASETMGTLVLVVDAKDQQAAKFYRHFDFLPVATIQRIVG